MEKNAKIYVAGHNGMVGSAFVRQLQAAGHTNIICKTHNELDLTRQAEVEKFFAEEKPEYVFLTAANVGGMMTNKRFPAEHMIDNTYIEMNVIKSAFDNSCKHLLFVSTNCMYPASAPLPIKESSLLQGSLDSIWEAYGIAKILGVKLCEYYSKQYGVQYISVVPCNLYGINDSYDPEKSHVVAANIKRFHEAKKAGLKSVEIWGDGSALREFLFADDLVNACLLLMDKYNDTEMINIAPGYEISIKDMALIIKDVVGYEGNVVFNKDKPNGVRSKKLDCKKLQELNWKPSTSFQEGIKIAYADFIKNNY